MFHGNVLVAHGLGFILGAHQHTVQVLADVNLSAGNLRPFVQRIDQGALKLILVDLHFLDQLEDQAVFLIQKTIEKVFLLNLLVSIFICDFLQVVDGLNGFLCKFIDIHKSCLLLV